MIKFKNSKLIYFLMLYVLIFISIALPCTIFLSKGVASFKVFVSLFYLFIIFAGIMSIKNIPIELEIKSNELIYKHFCYFKIVKKIVPFSQVKQLKMLLGLTYKPGLLILTENEKIVINFERVEDFDDSEFPEVKFTIYEPSGNFFIKKARYLKHIAKKIGTKLEYEHFDEA